MHRRIVLSLLAFSFCNLLWAQPAATPKLISPYYEPVRDGARHLPLAEWELTWRDTPVESTLELLKQQRWIRTSEPMSVQMALFKAGELPDPYVGLNSEKYRWVEEKAWYYRKIFQAPGSFAGHRLMLCFDGLDYFARIWLNGKLLGEHEGMFGGPYIDVSADLRPGGQNEIIVELRAANWGQRGSFQPRAPGRVVKPWVLTGGTGAEMFFPLGMWRGARIEAMPFLHLSRPFVQTLSATEREATVRVEVEVAVNPGRNSYRLYEGRSSRFESFLDTADTARVEPGAELRMRMTPVGVPGEVIVDGIPVELWNGRVRVHRDLTITSPRLWWPNGLGEQPLYRLEIELIRDGQQVDVLETTVGIRHLETVRSAGPATQDVWDDWQFRVNGRPFFVRGINWMPADVLLHLPREKYEWLLGMAKAGGIQMLRVWGGGLVETDEFYEICDRLGILVWQDFPLSNMQVPEWPHDVWEAQVASSVYRLRNHPSLALWCGGNEANPYLAANSAATGIFERWVRQLDGSRPVRRSSPDGGSIHEYPDMDPFWYGKRYQYAPFLAESGIHNVPAASTMREVIRESEFATPLADIYREDLGKDRPELRHHFVEFSASRVPRMLSRASHIADMRAPTLEAMAEATQMGAGEFYQVLSERMQAQYPITTGVLPWVYKRPWPVIAIQTVDGFGHPTAPYYFLKRSYEPTHVALQLPTLLWAPGESIPLDVDVIHHGSKRLERAVIHARVLGAGFEVLHENKGSLTLDAGPRVQRYSLGSFAIPESLANKFFFLVAELRDEDGALISRSVYWPRCPAAMADAKEREAFRATPAPWPTLSEGPWLKPQVSAHRAALRATVLSRVTPPGNRARYRIKVENSSRNPAFGTTITVNGRRHSAYASDNYFWLAPGETREIELEILWREENAKHRVTVQAWNAESVTLP